MPKAQMTLVDTLDDGVALVRQGKVDALIADHPFCLVSVYRYRDELATLDTRSPSSRSASRCRPNDPLLVNWTQNELADLDDSGTIYDMMYSWFEEDDWVTRLK
jgi:polar amino acid transport system substrate-binding protein